MPRVKVFWQSVSIAAYNTPRTGLRFDSDQQRLARRKLAQLDRMEDFASEYENFEQVYGADLPPDRVPVMRDLFATRYKRLVGVHPQRRHVLRRQLEPIAEGRDGDVARILEEINHAIHANGSLASPAEDAFA